MCIYTKYQCPWSVDILKYFTIVSHIYSFASKIHLVFPVCQSHLFLANTFKLFIQFIEFIFGSHIFSITPMTTYQFLVWQIFFSFSLFVLISFEIEHMCIYTKYQCPWSVDILKYFTIVSHIYSFASKIHLVFFVCQSHLFLANTSKLYLQFIEFIFGSHIFSITSMTTYQFLIWQCFFFFLICANIF